MPVCIVLRVSSLSSEWMKNAIHTRDGLFRMRLPYCERTFLMSAAEYVAAAPHLPQLSTNIHRKLDSSNGQCSFCFLHQVTDSWSSLLSIFSRRSKQDDIGKAESQPDLRVVSIFPSFELVVYNSSSCGLASANIKLAKF